MPYYTVRSASAVCALLVAASAAAQGTIKDYLFAPNAGPVAANDVIGVSKGVSSDLQTPRDLALSLGNIGDRDTQKGFGISITPARSGFDAVAVAADKYREGDVLRRIWGGTTFSYAQNRKKIGAAEFDQSALAVSASFLIDPEDDPIVIAYRALGDTSEAGVCRNGLQALEASERSLEEVQRSLVAQETIKLGRAPNLDELTAIAEKASHEKTQASSKFAAVRVCAQKAAADIAKKWNSHRVQILLGRGWIEPATGERSRLRLATHLKVSAALGVGADGLANLTWRRADDELDLTTLGRTAAFKSTNSAGFRYTYKASKKADMFAIAEVSSVKGRTLTASQTDFKQALGIDKRVAPGLWLEFRYGRARSAVGTSLENKALFALKFSEDTSLDKQTK
ncbi:MAG: hypothetical protein LH480_11370 [Rubrivivax sp.]|nr:hypothetical protein [Rubrivivax sp.]